MTFYNLEVGVVYAKAWCYDRRLVHLAALWVALLVTVTVGLRYQWVPIVVIYDSVCLGAVTVLLHQRHCAISGSQGRRS